MAWDNFLTQENDQDHQQRTSTRIYFKNKLEKSPDLDW